MPSSWLSTTTRFLPRVIPRYHHFDHLETLILAEKALPWSHKTCSGTSVFSTMPLSLKNLTIIDGGRVSLLFVLMLLSDHVITPADYLPNLRCINIYFRSARNADFLDDLNTKATQWGIRLAAHCPVSHYFPVGAVGGQPWKFTNEELLESIQRLREIRCIEK